MVYPSSSKLRPKGCWCNNHKTIKTPLAPRKLGQGSFFCPYHIVGNLINQILLCGNSPNIEFLNKGQGLIAIEEDPGAIYNGISEI